MSDFWVVIVAVSGAVERPVYGSGGLVRICVWPGADERGGHDASGRGGSVRRLSDVRALRSHVGDAQEVAPD